MIKELPKKIMVSTLILQTAQLGVAKSQIKAIKSNMLNWLKKMFKKSVPIPLVTSGDNLSRMGQAFDFVVLREGDKFSDRPADRGGPTKFGISLKNHPKMTREEIMNLTKDQAETIYQGEYWDRMGCDHMEWPYCLVVFDTAINEGCGGARLLMRNVTEASPISMSLQLITLRGAFYKRLAQKDSSQIENLQGWLNRLSLLKREIGLA